MMRINDGLAMKLSIFLQKDKFSQAY